MVDSGHVTATLRLAVGDIRIAHPVTVPAGPVPATAVVPALQGLVNAVVAEAEDQTEQAGKTISCRKGCGACCRQLVPISYTEGENLLAVIDALSDSRRAEVEARFAEANVALARAGLRDMLLDPQKRAGKTDRELSTAYFALGIPCPFLEEESCSIHADRPLVCREYLVTSPAERCAGPAQEGVAPVPVPKISLTARGLQDEADTWFPLALLTAWSRTRTSRSLRRTGPEWVQRFLTKLGSR
ncbi:MAG: YkgJ family cysteine cluster protein [Alphaproteobacteria bacterium]|nr:YkgJ family cysteine cluster protein [Alphaproteobacteria bacterium]